MNRKATRHEPEGLAKVALELVEKTGLASRTRSTINAEALRNPAIAHRWTDAHTKAGNILDRIEREIDAMPETKIRRALDKGDFQSKKKHANDRDLEARKGSFQSASAQSRPRCSVGTSGLQGAGQQA